MKKNRSHLIGVTSIVLGCGGVLLTGGCTQFADTHHKTSRALEVHSRDLTTGVVDVLNLQPAEGRDPFSQVALRLAREDQRIEGLPIDPIPVTDLVTGETNQAARAFQALEARFAKIERLLARERTSAGRLLEFGERFEQARNQSRARWAKWLGGGGLTLGGIVALCVFVPAAIPILGRILAWIVAKIPSLAGAIGVVSVKAFDAIVKGVERTKNSRLSNSEPAESELHLNLSREMDAAHKAVVLARKATFN